jgi:hypothetical protein
MISENNLMNAGPLALEGDADVILQLLRASRAGPGSSVGRASPARGACQLTPTLGSQDSGRKHEALRRARRSRSVGESSAVQPARSCRDGRLGLAGVGEDPCDHDWRVGAGGQDRGTLNDVAAGAVRTGQAGHQCANRVVVDC